MSSPRRESGLMDYASRKLFLRKSNALKRESQANRVQFGKTVRGYTLALKNLAFGNSHKTSEEEACNVSENTISKEVC